MGESVQYCPHPVKSNINIHDQDDVMLHFPILGSELSDDQRLRIEEILMEYGIHADLQKGAPRISVETDSQLIGEPVRRLAEAIRAVSEYARASC